MTKIVNEDIKSKNEFKVKDEIEMEPMKISNCNFDSVDKSPEIEKKTRKIIDKIKFSKVDLYLCLFCTRRRKNLQNVLINEGMKLVSQNLDIINIFINQMKIDNYLEQFKDNQIIILSDECKKGIEKFYYSYYLNKEKQ